MSEWVIVAIPAKDDPVWKLSSEKVPHITLVYLGDVTDPDKLGAVLYGMANAATASMPKFGLPVQSRGVLGDKKADVLFFDKDFTYKLDRLRRRLISSPGISEMYNAVKQFPTWTPHLTLGFPETPAPVSDIPVNWINFDRIALWTSDYAGPELLLGPDPRKVEFSDDVESVGEAYHSMTVDDFMASFELVGPDDAEQYGVKGQKWGVIRSKKQIQEATVTDPATGAKKAALVDTKTGSKKALSDEASRKREAEGLIKQYRTTDVLSNQDLRDYVQRVNLEKQYEDIVRENKQGGAGRKFIRRLLGDIGQAEVSRVARGASQLAVEEALRTHGQADLAARIKPKKK